ncbi:hypothetical protein E2R68_01495 [Psychromonas sp. RZ22]|uniref:hypothetical protein n=1 Tax=Psychromonas algarum TaxID=2555643 RepID=UPI001068B1B6|nr:hypothetical protein [Psychromonas sp. RZ22]TEW56743.1 hypothetical protein E2R68_01495 [Psychromonas sp. RZ22]
MFKNIFPGRIKSTISIYLGMHKVAICEEKNGQVTLIAGEFIQSDAEWPAVIKKMVAKYALKHVNVSVVIAKNFYQTFDIDKPQLEEKELLATLPFTIKDLVSESVFDLVVDYFDKPQQVRKNPQITIVCLPKSRVIAIREILSNNDLILKRVTTEEMAACQLFENSDEANILLSQQGNELLLSVVKNSQLYFSLRIRGYNEYLPMILENVESQLVEGLSLEIQRALDYINSQLGIQTIGCLYLALQCPDIQLLSEKLGSYLDKTVQPFDEQYDYHFLFAYGGFNKGLAE